MSDFDDFARLRWRCRRGMKELDQLMLRYLHLYYQTASLPEQQAFQTLLDYEEPRLLALLSGQIQSEDVQICQVVDKIRRSPVVHYS